MYSEISWRISQAFEISKWLSLVRVLKTISYFCVNSLCKLSWYFSVSYPQIYFLFTLPLTLHDILQGVTTKGSIHFHFNKWFVLSTLMTADSSNHGKWSFKLSLFPVILTAPCGLSICLCSCYQNSKDLFPPFITQGKIFSSLSSRYCRVETFHCVLFSLQSCWNGLWCDTSRIEESRHCHSTNF